MKFSYGSTWSPKYEREGQRSKFSCEPRRLGQISRISRKSGSNPLSASGTNSFRTDTSCPTQREDNAIGGKAIDQLADEVSEEIRYHEAQVGHLKNRLSELRQLSKELKQQNENE